MLAASKRGFYPSVLNANSNTILTNNWETQRNVTIVGVRYTAGQDGSGGMFISRVQTSAAPLPRIPVAGSNRKDRALARFAARGSRQNDMTPGFAQALADNWRIAGGMKPRKSGHALDSAVPGGAFIGGGTKGVKRTWIAPHGMSAYDPKRTWLQ